MHLRLQCSEHKATLTIGGQTVEAEGDNAREVASSLVKQMKETAVPIASGSWDTLEANLVNWVQAKRADVFVPMTAALQPPTQRRDDKPQPTYAKPPPPAPKDLKLVDLAADVLDDMHVGIEWEQHGPVIKDRNAPINYDQEFAASPEMSVRKTLLDDKPSERDLPLVRFVADHPTQAPGEALKQRAVLEVVLGPVATTDKAMLATQLDYIKTLQSTLAKTEPGTDLSAVVQTLNDQLKPADGPDLSKLAVDGPRKGLFTIEKGMSGSMAVSSNVIHLNLELPLKSLGDTTIDAVPNLITSSDEQRALFISCRTLANAFVKDTLTPIASKLSADEYAADSIKLTKLKGLFTLVFYQLAMDGKPKNHQEIITKWGPGDIVRTGLSDRDRQVLMTAIGDDFDKFRDAIVAKLIAKDDKLASKTSAFNTRLTDWLKPDTQLGRYGRETAGYSTKVVNKKTGDSGIASGKPVPLENAHVAKKVGHASSLEKDPTHLGREPKLVFEIRGDANSIVRGLESAMKGTKSLGDVMKPVVAAQTPRLDRPAKRPV